MLVATASIEATVRYFTLLEKNCHTQLLADAAGAPIKIGDYEAEDTYKTVGTISGGWFSGRPMFQQLEKEEEHRVERLGEDDAVFRDLRLRREEFRNELGFAGTWGK